MSREPPRARASPISGRTYTGPYDSHTLANTDFRIGPGVAPQAKLLAYRVFGCTGSTYLVTDAIERAVQGGADVINMSLGSPFGTAGTLDAIASDNASLAGVVVVAAAGNEGGSAYMTGTPGTATRAIAVAAVDAVPEFPGARLNMASGPDITGHQRQQRATAGQRHPQRVPRRPTHGRRRDHR